MKEPDRIAEISNEVKNESTPDRDPAVERVLWGVLLCLLVVLGGACVWLARTTSTKRMEDRPMPVPTTELTELRQLPDFSLVNQDGETVTLADLKGQVWIADFFFTHCPAQCPMITQRMAQIQKALPEGAAAKLVSITMDPEQDSPEVLAEYAKRFGADESRWIFLTGDKEAIIKLCKEGFLLPATNNPNDHSLRLTLVDQEGKIRGYFNSLDENELQQLQRRLNQLLAEGSGADRGEERS